MGPAGLLLNAYYELLYEKLEASRAALTEKIKGLLSEEIEKLRLTDFGEEKFAAYLDACLAFVDERLESYNPVGIQYAFDRPPSELAFQLELQLNFYDSSSEFEQLKQAAASLAKPDATDEELRRLAQRLVREMGAFPDKSIIAAYQAQPALGRLPDYVVSCAIEDIIRI
jgi:hypothetical protein